MVAKPLCPLYKNIIKPLDRARYPELRYNITISPQKEEQIYDSSGKKVTSIENGRIYIINGKKVISTTH